MLRSTIAALFLTLASLGCNSPKQDSPPGAKGSDPAATVESDTPPTVAATTTPAEELEYTTIRGKLTRVVVQSDGTADVEIDPSARRYYIEDPILAANAREWVDAKPRVVATGVMTGFPKTKKPQPSGGRGMRIVALELAPLDEAPR